MDSAKHSKSDPAVLLLNEIEILLAQARLMELYLKQAEATADHEMARLHERYQNELAALRAELTAAEQSSAQREAELALAAGLRAQVESLENRLAGERRAVESRDAALQSAKSDADKLRGRIDQLAAVHREAQAALSQAGLARQELEAELNSVRGQLAGQQERLREYQLVAQRSQEGLQSQLAQLRDQLASESTNAAKELESAAHEISTLHQRINFLQAGLQEAQTRAAQDIAQARAQFDSDLSALRSTLETREQSLQESQSALTKLERGLKSEIFALRRQLEQNQALLESRDQALSAGGARIGALERELTELAAAHRSAQATADDFNALRRANEKRIAELEQQAAAKERALNEHREALAAAEDQWHGLIQELQQDLARSRSENQQHHADAASARAEAETLRERIAELESAATGADLRAQELVGAVRRDLENEITGLRGALEREISTATQRENELRSTVDRLSGELGQRSDELSQQVRITGQAHGELEHLREELKAVETQKADSERARSQLEINWQEASKVCRQLENRLQAKDDELRERVGQLHRQNESALRGREESFQALEAQLHGELESLRAQLEEQRNATAQVQDQSGRLQNEIVALEARNIQTEQSRRDLEQSLEQSLAARADLEARLNAKDKEVLGFESTAQVEKEAALREQQTAFDALETQLRGELKSLREQAQNQQNATTQVAAEHDTLRTEIAALEARNAQLDELRRQSEQERNQSALLCQDLETRLQTQNQELQAAQASAARQLDQTDGRIHALENRLAEKQLLAEHRTAEAADLRADLSRALEKLAERDAVESETKAGYAREAESARAAHQGDLAKLREEFQAKQGQWETELAQGRQTLDDLTRQISQLEEQNLAADEQLHKRQQELAAAAADAESWRARFEQAEAFRQNESAVKEEHDQIRQRQESEIASLRHELQQKAWVSAQQQATLENLALTHKDQIQQYGSKIAEQRRSIEERTSALENVQSSAHLLEQRVQELQNELKQAQRTARDQAQQLSTDYAAKIDEMNQQLAQNSAELHESTASHSGLEQRLRDGTDRLIREAKEKNQILQDRNDELVRVKAEKDQLHERLNELKSAASQAEAALASETERMRTEFQAQVVLLQAELSQKQWVLEEQGAVPHSTSPAQAKEIGTLHRQRAQSEVRSDRTSDEFVMVETGLSEKQQTRKRNYREATAPVINSADPTFPASENRRWRSRFSWKRRWK